MKCMKIIWTITNMFIMNNTGTFTSITITVTDIRLHQMAINKKIRLQLVRSLAHY